MKGKSISYSKLDKLVCDINVILAPGIENAWRSDKDKKKKKVEVSYSDSRRFEHPLNIDKYNIDNPVIILGINPSSSDIDSKGDKKSVFLQYIDKDGFKDLPSVIGKYTYGTYFSQGYKLCRGFGITFHGEIVVILKIGLKMSLRCLRNIRNFLGTIL